MPIDFDWDYYRQQANKDRKASSDEAWRIAMENKKKKDQLLADAKKIVEQARKRGWVK